MDAPRDKEPAEPRTSFLQLFVRCFLRNLAASDLSLDLLGPEQQEVHAAQEEEHVFNCASDELSCWNRGEHKV